MKLFLTISVTLFFLPAISQVQVKSDSVIDIHGQYAQLIGKEMKSGKTVYFVYGWKGGLKKPERRELLNQWFTLYPEGKRGRSGRKILVTKNY